MHPENDPRGDGLEIAKAYAAATGGDRAGVLESSFVAEVKSDLMGEQTILCGMLQTGAVLNFEKMVANGIDAGYASKLIQYGWETITEALKHGGITGMMDRLDNPSKMKAYELAEELKDIMRPLYEKHQNDIITGAFSSGMMADWDNNDANLLKWRAETAETGFEKTPAGSMAIPEQEYFDNAVLMVAMVKAGVELAFDAMVEAGSWMKEQWWHRQYVFTKLGFLCAWPHWGHRRSPTGTLSIFGRHCASFSGVTSASGSASRRICDFLLYHLRSRSPMGMSFFGGAFNAAAKAW